jgi:nitronate monooxygenase
MWPKTRLTNLLGITYPILQAPMASISTAPLAAAVSRAGGLGFIGSATMRPEVVAAALDEARAITDRPVGLNFFVHSAPQVDEAAADRMWQRLEPQRRALGLEGAARPRLVAPPPFGGAMLERVLALRPAVVSFHFGVPDAGALAAIRSAGIRVLSTATTVAEARILAERGVDAIIAQGAEAGGHRGTFASGYPDGQIGTLALVPQVVDTVDVPVIAAGGIFDGRGIAAALLLGAAGVQLGTAFLGCPEAVIDPIYRRMLADPDRTARTRVTRLWSGRPARAIATRLLDELAEEETRALDFPLQRALTGALAAAAAPRGDAEHSAMWAGQAAARIRSLPAQALVAVLARETQVVLEGKER